MTYHMVDPNKGFVEGGGHVTRRITAHAQTTRDASRTVSPSGSERQRTERTWAASKCNTVDVVDGQIGLLQGSPDGAWLRAQVSGTASAEDGGRLTKLRWWAWIA